MRLLYLKYWSSKYQHPLNGFDQSFRNPRTLDTKINPLSLVGINGSGKSKLLEVLAEIFIYLHAEYDDFLTKSDDPMIEFLIEYSIRKDNSWIHVRIEKSRSSKILISCGENMDELKKVTDGDTISSLLPVVVGYTSGENETLSNFFQPYAEGYAEYYQSSALTNTESRTLPDLPRFLWLDFSMNKKVFLANAILSNDSKWQSVKDRIKLDRAHSFRVTIQLKPKTGPSMGIIPASEQQEIIEKLKQCATLKVRRGQEEQINS